MNFINDVRIIRTIMPITAKVKILVGMFVVLILVGCEQWDTAKSTHEVRVVPNELDEFVGLIEDNLVFVEGGKFLMGDYGQQYGPEKLPYDADKDSKPLHRVQLTGYSVEKYKVTNHAFQFYLKSNGLHLRQDAAGINFERFSSPPNNPAHMDWYEADRYCRWLADISSLPFALPTEAQWEYAARSRGQYLMVATDDGTYKVASELKTGERGPRGVNISTSWDRRAYAKEMGWRTAGLTPLPVNKFPPNPLGLYSMSDNGQEWIKDWYDPDYYTRSPLKDPQGPDKPMHKDYYGRTTKVVRGQGFADPAWGGGVNVHRASADPSGRMNDDDLAYLSSKTARCVVNSPKPLK